MPNLILDKGFELLKIGSGLIFGLIGLLLIFLFLVILAALIVNLIEHIVGTSHE